MAASSKHSGDWLYALPVTSCGMRLDDEAMRVAIGLELCVPHQCHFGAQVDSFGRHAFVCKKAAGRSIRHHALNELVARAVLAAAIPNTKEPHYRRVYVVLTGKSPMDLLWFRGRAVDLLFGTSQLTVPCRLLCCLGCQRS